MSRHRNIPRDNPIKIPKYEEFERIQYGVSIRWCLWIAISIVTAVFFIIMFVKCQVKILELQLTTCHIEDVYIEQIGECDCGCMYTGLVDDNPICLACDKYQLDINVTFKSLESIKNKDSNVLRDSITLIECDTGNQFDDLVIKYEDGNDVLCYYDPTGERETSFNNLSFSEYIQDWAPVTILICLIWVIFTIILVSPVQISHPKNL